MTCAQERDVTRRGRHYRVLDDHPCRPADDPNNVDFWTLFETAAWEPELDDILTDHLTPDSAFLDIGAWVGPVSLIASQLCGVVYAVEPDPAAADRFRRNRWLSLAGNMTLTQAAITPVTGLARVGVKSGGAWGDSMTSVLYDHETAQVDGYRLADWFTASVGEPYTRRVGLVKMDVEGAEAEILADAAGWLHDLGAPLLVSLHQPLRPDPADYARMVLGALEWFRCEVVDGGAWDGFCTVLAVPA